MVVERAEPAGLAPADRQPAHVTRLGLDVVFPVLHGPYGEDGTIQGLLELANVPYVGAGVLASAVGMDKAVMKVLFAARGLPIVDLPVVLHASAVGRRRRDSRPRDRAHAAPAALRQARQPRIERGHLQGPSRRASSRAAIELAGAFDRKIVIEAAVPTPARSNARVLGNDEPEASVPGEIVPSREFYDYEAKYLDEASRVDHPRAADAERQTSDVRAARRRGVPRHRRRRHGARRLPARRRHRARSFVNEINTIPGFTTISMYAQAVGGDRRRLSGAARSSRDARPRTPRGEAAASHERDVRRSRHRRRELFDFFKHFVLDSQFFSSIIYILYEGGWLRPPVVRPRFRLFS